MSTSFIQRSAVYISAVANALAFKVAKTELKRVNEYMFNSIYQTYMLST